MIYVFDSSTLIRLFRNFYLSRFPSLWEKFDQAVKVESITSVREVCNEIEQHDDRLSAWAKSHRDFFQKPSEDEKAFVAEIFRVAHFQSMVRNQQRLEGKPPVADPFVIARARVLKGCVVTEEVNTPNAARIPNVCGHFGIAWLSLEGFMEEENWTF